MVLLAPISLLPLDLAAAVWFAACLGIVVWLLRKSSLLWILFVPFLQGMFLGQIDPFFWLVYRSKRPAVWALLSLKPQLLPVALPNILASKRNAMEFLVAAAALHIPFLLVRPTWPGDWLNFLSGYQNRVTEITASTVSGQIVLSWWALPFAVLLIGLVALRRKNLEGAVFLINPFLIPYDYLLLMGAVSPIAIPLSWLALALAWKVQAGWPYVLLMLIVLAFETVRERRTRPQPRVDALH
jgi:hypothetical protein